jgi:hypothetical protein
MEKVVAKEERRGIGEKERRVMERREIKDRWNRRRKAEKQRGKGGNREKEGRGKRSV